ncbi:MAG: hypothetical protein ABI467_32320 [Kofleriaceae bacterium]
MLVDPAFVSGVEHPLRGRQDLDDDPCLVADEPLDADQLADWQRRQSGGSLPRLANQTATISMRLRSYRRS